LPLTVSDAGHLSAFGCIDRTEFGRGETRFGLVTEASKRSVLTCVGHIDPMHEPDVRQLSDQLAPDSTDAQRRYQAEAASTLGLKDTP
jgi:hypothetical protein